MEQNTNFTVKFWGVRGSHPVSDEQAIRYGGNTSCVEVQAGEHTMIFDAGTGIIGLGRVIAQEAQQRPNRMKIALFFSHLHHDHTQGFPFFAPAYFTNTHLDLFVPDMYERDPKSILTEVMSAPTFPVSFQQTGAEKHIHSLQQTQTVIINHNGIAALQTLPSPIPENSIIIRTLRSYAHPQGVMLYRVEYQGKSMVYATDTEGYVNGDQRLIHFARGVDLLIHDAQYTEDHYLGQNPSSPVTQGYGHSTASMACKVAKDANAGQLVLFHHDPSYSDKTIARIEREARLAFINTVAAREGQVINLGESQSQAKFESSLLLAKKSQPRGPITPWAST